MKTRILGIIGLLTTLCACNPAPQHSDVYTIKAEVSDSSANGKMAYLMRYDDNKHVDSAMVKDNQIIFTGKVDTAS